MCWPAPGSCCASTATRLRLGEDAEIVMTGLRFNVPAETGLALLERVDPVLSPGFVDGADDDN